MYEYTAIVARVIDGDTVDLEVDLGLRVCTKARFRLAGINAPDTAPAKGESMRWLVEQIPHGTKVMIQTDKDRTEKYGRWLVTIYRWPQVSNMTSINDLIVKEGHAVPYHGGPRS